MSNQVIKGTTCFAEHARCKLTCKKEHCRQWIDDRSSLNCTLLAAIQGPKTLEEIGQIFDLTRMRICQIEKNTLEKLNEFQQLKEVD